MNIPQIRIQSSMLLFNSVSETERARWANKTNQPLLTLDDIEEYTKQLQSAWAQSERTILESMVELYGIEFKKSIIDIYVNPWNTSISNPMIISPNRPANIQVETITHELLHVLFTDNTSFSIHDDNHGVKLLDAWRDMFGEEFERKTLVHIPVHAGLKAIFLDTLDSPEKLERDIAFHQKHPPYKQAWEYIETNNYKGINARLKMLYVELGAVKK